MDEKTKELIALAASVAGHCQPCFLLHMEIAKQVGVTEDEIREAIRWATAISENGDKQMSEFVNENLPGGAGSPKMGCGCT